MAAHARSTSNGRGRHEDRWAVPLLDARRGTPAERFAGRLRGRHPAAVFFAALLAGFVVLGLISIALGLLVTDVLLDTGGLAGTDESVVKSIVAERTPFLTDASEVGSTLGGAPLLPILVSRTYPRTPASRPVTLQRRSRSTPASSCSSRRGSQRERCDSSRGRSRS
jgi:hypothetical protein